MAVFATNIAGAPGLANRRPDEASDSLRARVAPVRVPLPQAVRVFWVGAFLLFGLALAVAAIGSHAGSPKTQWDAWSDPLLGDLMEYPGTYRLLHSKSFFDNAPPVALPASMFSAVAYPPFAAAVLTPFYVVFSPVWGYLCVTISLLAAAFWYVRQEFQMAGISPYTATCLPLSLMLISFPIERLVHQGNFEVLVWAFAATGIWLFLNGRRNLAAALWGLAAAMKLFPILLLVLLLSKRSFRAVLLGLSVFAGATWLSLLWLGPTVASAWQGSVRNVFGYQDLRVSEWSLRELVANHSLLGWFKLGAIVAHVPSSRLMMPYYVFGMIAIAWAFAARLEKMPVANQVLAVTVCMLLLPSVSYYHTLVHLYAPLLMLIFLAIRAQRAGVYIRGLQTTMLLCLPLFVPYTLLTFPRMMLFCGMLQALALISLFLCAMEFPFALQAMPPGE